MPGAERRRAKLPPDLVAAGPAAPLAETLLCRKGTATAVGFRPRDWSYERNPEPALLPVVPIANPVEAAPGPPPIPREPVADAESPSPGPRRAEIGAEEHLTAKQALAADLAEMIEDMLRTTQFATAATSKTRHWTTQMGEAKALWTATVDTGVTASSLTAELARARPAPVVRPAASGGWIDAVLVLACVVMALSAGYFAFAL